MQSLVGDRNGPGLRPKKKILSTYYYKDYAVSLLGPALAARAGRADTPGCISGEVLLRGMIKSDGPLRESLVVFVAVVAGYLLLRNSALFLVGAFNDDGAYTLLGKSIADGNGYRLNYLPGNPVAVKYPPGLPALLAIPWSLGGTLAAVRATVAILNPLVCGVAAALIWLIGRRYLALSPGAIAVAALGPLFLDTAIQYYNIPLSEPYFLLGWAAAVMIASTTDRFAGAVALGVVLAITSLFRSAGLVLIPACLAALALRRVPWRVVALCAAVAIAPLVVWGIVHGQIVAEGPLSASPDEVSYWTWIPFGARELPGYLLIVLWNNMRTYFHVLSGALAGPAIVGHLLVAGTLAAAAVGAAWSWRRAPALALTTAASLAVVLVWPFAQDRFLLPVIPFIGLLAAFGIEEGARRLPARFRVGAPIVLAVLALIVGLRQMDLRRAATAGFVSGQQPAARDASIFFVLAVNSRHIAVLSDWVRTNTAPQDRLLVDFPAATHMYSGRLTAPASPSQSPYKPSVFEYPGRYLARRILDDSVTVVAIGIQGPIVRDIETVTRTCPGVLQRVVQSAEFYRVNRDDACLRRIAPP